MPHMNLVQMPELILEPEWSYIAYFHRGIQHMVVRRKEQSSKEGSVGRVRRILKQKYVYALLCTDRSYRSAWITMMSHTKDNQHHQKKAYFLWMLVPGEQSSCESKRWCQGLPLTHIGIVRILERRAYFRVSALTMVCWKTDLLLLLIVVIVAIIN